MKTETESKIDEHEQRLRLREAAPEMFTALELICERLFKAGIFGEMRVDLALVNTVFYAYYRATGSSFQPRTSPNER